MAVLLLLGGCGSGTRSTSGDAPSTVAAQDPPPPPVTARRRSPAVTTALGDVLSGLTTGSFDFDALEVVAGSRDPRLAWVVADLLRFVRGGREEDALIGAFAGLTGIDPGDDGGFRESPWRSVTNQLITWDLPAPPGYRQLKGRLFTQVEPGWRPFFVDADADIDWRIVSWGGVLIDDRPLGDKRPCARGCIPALDDPLLTDAAGGGWYPDDRVVFGVIVGADAVALPKNVMEVHELVNITISGRRLGIPYCTLCASAQAYFTDDLPRGMAAPVLRTSGLLSRSNKMMYDLRSHSVIDTFTGRALSGPLHDSGITLRETTVVTSTWGAWKASHPETRIVARDGGVGASYPDDPLGGRDANGPIFPVGPVDPRLPVQAKVLGVIGPQGPVAFPVELARGGLRNGRPVVAAGVELSIDGDGLRARRVGGRELTAHEAFWFAWSQFHPSTGLWTG